jgi:phage recombination protein Bet
MSGRDLVAVSIPSLTMNEVELMGVLRSSLYPGAKDESIKMVIGWCRAQQKDPMKRPVHIVPMSVKKPGTDAYEWRDVLMPGIGDYRTDAARTGVYAGIDEAVFGADATKELGGVTITFPEWCEVTVYRVVGGQRCPFSSGKIRWLETYATAKKDTAAPNSMWRKRPYGQIEKCAEAMALRRAFPEVGAQPTAEEMEGRVIDPEAIEGEVVGKAVVEPPRSKSESHPVEAKETLKQEPVVGEPKPAPESMKKMLHARLASAEITEVELLKHYDYTDSAEKFWAELTLDRGNEALKWIANPS